MIGEYKMSSETRMLFIALKCSLLIPHAQAQTMRFLFKSLWGKTINRFIELEINKIKNNKIIGKSRSGKLY